MRKIIIICLIFLGIANFTAAQTFWENTRYGMTIEQVQALFPSAAIPENPREHPLYGDIERLRDITKITINASGPTYNFDVEYEFEVAFYFSTRGLTQVVLTLLHAWADALYVFDDLSKTLTERHGRPEVSRRDTGRWEDGWISGSTLITLRWEEPIRRDISTGLSLIYHSL